MRRVYVDVGGLTCPKKGSKSVVEALNRAIRRAGLEEEVQVIPRGCFGLCNLAPNLYIEPDGIWYSRFTVRDASIIVRQHLVKEKPVLRLIHYPDRRLVKQKKGGLKMPETLVAREVEVGDIAPDFTLKDQDGKDLVLSSFRGKKNVVLAFYPFDWSPVCTTENCALTEDLAKFEGKETVILGISCDSHFSHKAWGEKLGLKQTLLSDLKREVSKKYGLFFEELNCSKRATVVIDRSGKVIFKKVQEIKVARNDAEILAAIK
jgi:peroxiredoxin/(2Fe-2S) ferredoxin